MKSLATTLLLLIASGVAAESFWGGFISYNPPPGLQGSPDSGNAGLPITGRTYLGTNSAARVAFKVVPPVAVNLQASPAKAPAYEIKDTNTLVVVHHWRIYGFKTNETNGVKVEFKPTKVSGLDASSASFTTKSSAPANSGTMYVYDLLVAPQPRIALMIQATAEDEKTLEALKKSLASIRIDPKKTDLAE